MSQNLQKKPSKGILKSSRSVDNTDGTSGAPSTSKRTKEMKFDEMNIMETFHPANKDYGHMKVDEPKTPFSEAVDVDLNPGNQVDANILAAKLAAQMNQPPKCTEPQEQEDEDDEETREKRKMFENKRKQHYNEFQALQLARQLMEQEEDEDDDDSLAT